MHLVVTAFLVCSFGWVAFSFGAGLVQLWQASGVTVPTTVAIAPVPPAPVLSPCYIADSTTHLSCLGVRALRVECTRKQIPWKDINGKNKHARKAQMLQALQQLEAKAA